MTDVLIKEEKCGHGVLLVWTRIQGELHVTKMKAGIVIIFLR